MKMIFSMSPDDIENFLYSGRACPTLEANPA